MREVCGPIIYALIIAPSGVMGSSLGEPGAGDVFQGLGHCFVRSDGRGFLHLFPSDSSAQGRRGEVPVAVPSSSFSAILRRTAFSLNSDVMRLAKIDQTFGE